MNTTTIKESLAHFYSTHANDFSRTRKKHRPEIDSIINYINTLPQKSIRLLELGCGDGRLLSYIEKNCNKQIHYTGIDIADWLINIAKKNHKNWTFICSDMTTYIDKQKQEKYDCIISIAAFQHIPTIQERQYLIKLIYRSLKYYGIYAMTNWSRSQRFIQKYRKQITKSLVHSAFTHNKKWNDISIPRKGKKETQYRYYHIFTKSEIEFLVQDAGFLIQDFHFSHKNWWKTTNRRKSKNTVLIAKKTTHDFPWN